MLVVTMHKSYSKCITVLFALFLSIFASSKKKVGLIYILQYTYIQGDSWDTYWNLQWGRKAFVSRNCSYQNCYFVKNQSYFDSILDFDVLVFNTQQITPSAVWNSTVLPSNRSEEQLYVLVSSEPATLYPLSRFYDGFFNATWTYKFSSDIFHPFFVVKNNIGDIIGPKLDMHWPSNADFVPTNSSVLEKLKTKHIAAAWVASAAHCDFLSHSSFQRYGFIRKLKDELAKYGHTIDIYGTCGNLNCSRDPLGRAHVLHGCHQQIQSDYYFYLAFENSFSADYVTEKVLHGLQHYSVPIVFGSADYGSFLPNGSYIHALKLGEKELAKEMNDIINNASRYYDFFKWHGYYSFQDTTDKDHRETICELCAFLNRQRYNKTVQIHHNISVWWNTKRSELIAVNKYFTTTLQTPTENLRPHEYTDSGVTSFMDFLLDE